LGNSKRRKGGVIMTKEERFQWELKTLTEGMIEGSAEYMEQIIWLNNEYRKKGGKEMKIYRFEEFYIRENMMDSLQRYINEKVPVGDFLTAVLENNLSEACGRADDENLRNIPAYVAYLYNEAPSPCWGSPGKVKEWLSIDNLA